MRALAFPFAFLIAVGCSKSSPPAPSANASGAGAEAKAAAEEIFKTRCVPCHGATGHGDGAASAGLTPKPRNFSDPAWQAEVDDAHIAKIIQYGGAAVNKSAAMPPNPDLGSKPDVILALKDKIRGFKGQ